ncbi:MAG TPA: hypothetical protein VEB66_16385, partial [Opitutaceae bacterium]|nr:hypothetical protein [Opitutaceae bacterium]
MAPAAALALAALGGSVLAGRLCPFQIAPEPRTPVTEALPAPVQPPALSLSVSKIGTINGTYTVFVAGQGQVRRDYVAVDAGSPPLMTGELLQIQSVESALTLADGTERRYPAIGAGYALGLRHAENAIRATLGLPARTPREQRRFPLRLFSVGPDENPAPPDRAARVRSRLKIAHLRYSVEARMPLRAGAKARLGARSGGSTRSACRTTARLA